MWSKTRESMWSKTDGSEAKSSTEGLNTHKPLDFSKLVADSHLTQEEQRIVSEAFETDKDTLLSATKWKLRNFIRKDYESANMQALGGFERILQLQKALGMKREDITGTFGPTTFQTLIEYQKSNGIRADAIAGRETMAKLELSKVEFGQTEPWKKDTNWPSQSNSQETASHNDAQSQKPAWVQERKLHEHTVQKPAVSDTGKPAAPVQDVTPTSPGVPKKPDQNQTKAPTAETQTVSAAPTIRKLSLVIGSLEEQIKTINENRKENTGVVSGIWDALVKMSGSKNETGKDIYEHQIKAVQDQAKDLHSKVLAEFTGKSLSPSDKTEVDALVARLETAGGAKLAKMTWWRAVFNSVSDANSASDAISHGVIGAKGGVKSIIEWAVDFVTGIADLSIFLCKYAGGALGINPEYKSQIDDQCSKIYGCLKEEGLLDQMGGKAKEVMTKEWDRIMTLPPDEQAEAIGWLAGKVMWALMVMKGGAMLAGKVSHLGDKSAQAERILQKLAEKWQAGSARAERVAGLAEKTKDAKNVFKIADKILNGPAESLIGATLATTLSKTLAFVKTAGVSVAEKFAHLKSAIGEMDMAIKSETNAVKKENIWKAKEALVAEEANLHQEQAHEAGSELPAKKRVKNPVKHIPGSAQAPHRLTTPKYLDSRSSTPFGKTQTAFLRDGTPSSGTLVQLSDGTIGLHIGKYKGKQIINICTEVRGKLRVIRQAEVLQKDIVSEMPHGGVGQKESIPKTGHMLEWWEASDVFLRQFDTYAKIQQDFMQILKDRKYGPLLDTLSTEEFVQKITQEHVGGSFQKLSSGQQESMKTVLGEIIAQTQKVRKYLMNPKYINNHKQLAADIFKVDIQSLKWEVLFAIDPPAMYVSVENKDDFYLLYALGNVEKANTLEKSDPAGWYFLPQGHWLGISELEGALTLENGKWTGSRRNKEVRIHEARHAVNAHVSPELDRVLHPRDANAKFIPHAKNEIIAFLADGRSIHEIKQHLTQKGGAYDYFRYNHYTEDLVDKTRDYETLWKEHTRQICVALDIASRFQRMNIPHYIDLLAITPIEHWWALEKVYTWTASIEEKTKLHLQLLKTHGFSFTENADTFMKNAIYMGLSFGFIAIVVSILNDGEEK